MNDGVRRPVERIVPKAARPPLQAGLHVDVQGYICVDGVRVARLVERNGRRCLRFHDKCKRRSRQRGEPFVDVPVAEIARLDSQTGENIVPEVIDTIE